MRNREEHYAFQIFHFAAFDFAVLGGVIGVGQVFAYRGEAGTSVRPRDDLVRIETMLHRPAMPYPGDRASGVDQDAVEVE